MTDDVLYVFIVLACCCLSIVCFTGKTALFIARSAEAVTALIDGKADVNATDRYGTDIHAIFRPYVHMYITDSLTYTDIWVK